MLEIKRNIVWLIMLSIVLSNLLFAPTNKELTDEVEEVFKEIAYEKANKGFLKGLEEKSEMYKDKDYYYYKNIMPREFLEVFLLSTENIKHRRILVYSVMIIESMNFSEYYNKNTDDSTDHGPMMLNSKNIECMDFNSKFFPKEDFINRLKESDLSDNHILYTAASVNLLKAHLEMYKGDVKKSLKAYNGGPKVNRKKYQGSLLDRKTTRYYNKCMKVYNRVKADYNNFNTINKDKDALTLYKEKYFNFEREWDSYKKYRKLMLEYPIIYIL